MRYLPGWRLGTQQGVAGVSNWLADLLPNGFNTVPRIYGME
jgi:hypothetical protein